MSDRWTDGWTETLVINNHRLTWTIVNDFTLDDPDADTDPTVVEDRARMYRVGCETCRFIHGEAERTVEQRLLLGEVADFAVNKRTGEWLVCHRPGVDDPDQDTLGLLVEHCRPTFVCLLDVPHERLAVPLAYGDLLDVDAEAVTAARMLSGFGSAPWEALTVYRDSAYPV